MGYERKTESMGEGAVRREVRNEMGEREGDLKRSRGGV
jgi:hypothetical protein